MMKHTLSAIVMITMVGSVGNVAADDSGVLRDLVAGFNALQRVTVPLVARPLLLSY